LPVVVQVKHRGEAAVGAPGEGIAMGGVEVAAAIAGKVGLVVEQPQHQAAVGGQPQGLHPGQIVGHRRAEGGFEPVDLIPTDVAVVLMQGLAADPRRPPRIRQTRLEGIHLGGG